MFETVLLNEKSQDNEIIASLGVFCDYFEFTSDGLWNNPVPIIQLFYKYSYHSNATVRYNSEYGIRLYAELQEKFHNK